MSDYKSPDELIRELVNVLSSAEADLIALRQVDNSGRTKETLGEIYRVKELVEYNSKYSNAKSIDLFNRRL
jgi:hypothetical protein|tara:strand:- start:37 stop:249 length:213 start_codon:yes stop_codon:yes gene_type:complete